MEQPQITEHHRRIGAVKAGRPAHGAADQGRFAHRGGTENPVPLRQNAACGIVGQIAAEAVQHVHPDGAQHGGADLGAVVRQIGRHMRVGHQDFIDIAVQHHLVIIEQTGADLADEVGAFDVVLR